MRTKVTLVLIFLNLVLFYYIFYFEDRWKKDREMLEARRRVLPPEIAGMDSFSRTSRSGQVVRLEKDKRGDNWWLTQPYEWPANLNSVVRIHNELQFLENQTKFKVADLPKTGLSLADYGLAQPAMTIVYTAGGRSFELKVGDDTKTGNRLYVLSPDGEYVHVVGRSLADTLGLPLAELRSESVFTVPVFEVRSLSVQSGTTKTRLRRDAARWVFETPIQARAGKAAVETTVNSLNALHARRFVEARDPELERSGLDNPILRVTLEGNARRETLLIGGPAPLPEGTTPEPDAGDYYARFEDKPVVFTTSISQALLTDLKGAQEKLRDTRVLDFDPQTVSSITVTSAGQPTLTLQRLEGAAVTEPDAATGWQLVQRAPAGQAPATQPADPEVVARLLRTLQELTAVKFVTEAPSAADIEALGFNRPDREVTLNFPVSANLPYASSLTLLLGSSPDRRDAAFAKLGNSDYIYQVSPEVLREVPSSALDFRTRLIRELPSGARLTGLKLVDLSSGNPVCEYTAAAGAGLTAESIAPGETPDRRKALIALLGGVRSLRAGRFVALEFSPDGVEYEGTLRKWKYRLEVSLVLASGAESAQTEAFSVNFSERLGGTTQLGGTGSLGGVSWVLPQDILDALFALTYAPVHDPGPPPAQPAPPASAP